jgi:hypothetical protein
VEGHAFRARGGEQLDRDGGQPERCRDSSAREAWVLSGRPALEVASIIARADIASTSATNPSAGFRRSALHLLTSCPERSIPLPEVLQGRALTMGATVR